MRKCTEMMKTLKTIWWVTSLILFAETIRRDGMIEGLINWINPLTPP